MIRNALLWTGTGFLALLSVACGRPKPEPLVPAEVTNFQELYSQNCAGCHGVDGLHGPAQALHNAVYLAVIPKDTLRQVIANGVPGSLMPGFSAKSGGDLTDEQLDIVTNGIETWANPSAVEKAGLPSYSTAAKGDPAAGAKTFQAACASCHGLKGDAGSLTDQSFLQLATDQSLRTTTIAGRPDLGMPDWRRDLPARPLTSAEIDDVVAYMSSQRPGPLASDQPSAPPAPSGGEK